MKGLFLVRGRGEGTEEMIWSGYDIRKWLLLLRSYLIYVCHSVSFRHPKPRLYSVNSPLHLWPLGLSLLLLISLEYDASRHSESSASLSIPALSSVLLSRTNNFIRRAPPYAVFPQATAVANKAAVSSTEPKFLPLPLISVNYLPKLPCVLYHQGRKPFEALISWAKLGEIGMQWGDWWGHFSERRDREKALENMPLKVTAILRVE